MVVFWRRLRSERFRKTEIRNCEARRGLGAVPSFAGLMVEVPGRRLLYGSTKAIPLQLRNSRKPTSGEGPALFIQLESPTQQKASFTGPTLHLFSFFQPSSFVRIPVLFSMFRLFHARHILHSLHFKYTCSLSLCNAQSPYARLLV